MSSGRANTSATKVSWVSVRAASNSTTSTVVATAWRASSAAVSSAVTSRPARITVRQRSPTSLRTVARAMSLVPPSTSTDWTDPNASFMETAPRVGTLVGLQAESAGEVGAHDPRRVHLLAHCAPFVESRVHGREQCRAKARVLGEVDGASGLDDEVVEAVEQSRQLGIADRDVERERPAFARERQRCRVRRAEALQHREERCRSGRAEVLERDANGLTRRERNLELVLEEAARSVHAIPTRDAVEGMPKRRNRLQAVVRHRRLAEPHLVERPDRERVDEAVRHPRRRRESDVRPVGEGIGSLSVSYTHLRAHE